MAIIFEKTSNDKCLILNPRESFVYPFDVGIWSEIRCGGFFSLTSTGNNDLFSTESVTLNAKKNIFSFGIKDSGASLPTSDLTFFMGNLASGNSSDTSRIESDGIEGGGGNKLPLAVTIGKNYASVSNPAVTFGDWRIPLATNTVATGDSQYAYFYGLRFVIGGVDATGKTVVITASRDSAGTSDVSISNLRSKLSSLANAGTAGPFNYYTGTPAENISLPNSIYVNWPFFNNQLRIHSLLLEKWA